MRFLKRRRRETPKAQGVVPATPWVNRTECSRTPELQRQGERFWNVQMYQFAVAFDTSCPKKCSLTNRWVLGPFFSIMARSRSLSM